ncbi:gas vesicle protein GvpO [Falsibacillus pallidus]|uniref:Gas vesicle protein GvpO n=1 Tax=Falsibacillus pallidus TaxID=493781 RepID=A0A370GRV1_9BACI|nr:gas vesicle protein GvpO [Falsibacillus pallidus]RDI45976.1 gas vesicle protein GvpO [Falsibacillus pallidus]
MEIKKVMKTVSDFFQENIAPPHKITSVDLLEEDGWKVTIEVVEEKEYMKKYAKDEMIGMYTVLVNEKGEITSFNRIDIRYRSAIG